jgi:hypothetical protein
MKTCTNCGATLNDTDSFCTSCGATVPVAYLGNAQPKTPITVGGWIGRYLIPCIPFVGGIIYLVMLFIWSGDSTKEETFRNWAKAQLIMTAIGFVLGIIFAVVFGVAIAELAASSYYY